MIKRSLYVLAALLLWEGAAWSDSCVYTGGYPWQTNSCLTHADLNAAIAAALAPPSSLAPGVAATNLGNAAGEVSGPWSNLQLARPIPRAAIPTPLPGQLGGVKSITNTAHMFVTHLDVAGLLHQSQPVLADLADLPAASLTFLTTSTSANFRAMVSDETGTGLLYFQGGNLGTPSAGVLTNATGLPISTGLTGVAAGGLTFWATPTSANLRGFLTDETGTGLAYFQGGDLGTPSAGVLTNATGLPVSTGISGLASGVAAWLAAPSSANLLAALTTKTGTGNSVFATSPTLVTPDIGAATGTSLVTTGSLTANYVSTGGFGLYLGGGISGKNFNVGNPSFYIKNTDTGGVTFQTSSGATAVVVTDAGLLQFAGATASFPSLKPSGTTLRHRLGDDSADGPMSASSGIFSTTLMLGSATALTLATGEHGFAKIAASGTAPGAAGVKEAWVCGTNAGTAKKIAYGGTSTTPALVVDNVGAGVAGC